MAMVNQSLYTSSTTCTSRISSSSSKPPRRNPNPKSSSSSLKFQISNNSRSSSSSNDELWFREEQRWLREEQRWLREETRWRAERESLLGQISHLIKIKSNNPNNIVLKDVARIAESGGSSAASHMVLETTTGRKGDKADDVKSSLKKGLQGEDVRLMQEALLKLGFYSGEEDMEYSTFSTGTERAVKTWQASLGLSEDGVMTLDHLQVLYGAKTVMPDLKKYEGRPNGAADASITQKSQVPHRTTVKGKAAIQEVDVTKPRVFLLGENRWEEPSRLIGRDTPGGPSKTTPKCPACHGQGRILCMECDGTGEPNIEEQFMEWVDEGAKCPYCDGLGEVTCDLCGVKTTI